MNCRSAAAASMCVVSCVGCEPAVCDRSCPFREGWADGADRAAQIQNADDLQTAMLIDIGTGQGTGRPAARGRDQGVIDDTSNGTMFHVSAERGFSRRWSTSRRARPFTHT